MGTGQRRTTTAKRPTRPAVAAPARGTATTAADADDILAEARATALEIVGIARDLAREAEVSAAHPAPPPDPTPVSVARLAPIAAELERLAATIDDWSGQIDALRADVTAAARAVLDEQAAAVLAAALAAMPESPLPATPVPPLVEEAVAEEIAAAPAPAPAEDTRAARRRFGSLRREAPVGLEPAATGPALKPGFFGR